jgi:N-methylhydantoinase B
MADFFEGEIYDGDVLMCNLAYLGNTHMGEPTIASPVFYEGKLVFWAVARGHMMDMGQPQPCPIYPYAKDLYSEGLKIPPLKLYEQGKVRRDVLELYLTNLRQRSLTYGDLMAHVAATWVGKDRLIGLLDHYGLETVKLYTQELLDYTDRRVAVEIRKMKPGTYYGEDWIDSNMFGTKDIPIRAKLTVKDDEWIVDLSDNIPQVIGSVNSSLHGCTESAVAGSLAFCIDPEIPKNEGLCRHYQIICPEGTILSAQPPFSTQMATIAAGECLYRALIRAAAGACPQMVVAGSTFCRACHYYGTDYRDGRNVPFFLADLNEAGGGGASLGNDGNPTMLEMGVAGSCMVASVEITEWLFPFLVEQWEILTDSQGAGKWRGAPGVITRMKAYECSPVEASPVVTGQRNLTYGVLGGKPGPGGATYVCDSKNPEKKTFMSISSMFYLQPGWVHVAISGGGGGYGDPLERDPKLVRADVRDEFVSVAAAREEYGVIVDPKTYKVDYKGTQELRDKIRRERGELQLVSPTKPGHSTTLREMMTEEDEYLDLDRKPEAWG